MILYYCQTAAIVHSAAVMKWSTRSWCMSYTYYLHICYTQFSLFKVCHPSRLWHLRLVFLFESNVLYSRRRNEIVYTANMCTNKKNKTHVRKLCDISANAAMKIDDFISFILRNSLIWNSYGCRIYYAQSNRHLNMWRYYYKCFYCWVLRYDCENVIMIILP